MQHQNVFVCGLHRSGTSVLARVLRHHPQTSGFRGTGAVEDEGQFLQTVYPPAFRYGGPGVFGFDPRSCFDETSPLISAENAAKLHAEWARYWEMSCPVLLEKSPPNLVRTRFLQAMFQDARFVVILRHPIAVSLATKNGRPRIPLYSLIEHWLICHERFLVDRAHLNQVHVLRYEDLVARPEAVMDDVWRFLGLEPVPLAEPIRSHNERYLTRWGKIGQPVWGRAYLDWICRRFEARTAVFGYSLADPRFLAHTLLVPKAGDVPRPSLFSRALTAGTAVWERVNRGPLQTARGWLHRT
jgi:hypothetical protein